MACTSATLPSGIITALRRAYQLNSQGLRVMTTASAGRCVAIHCPAAAKLSGPLLLAAVSPMAARLGQSRARTARGRMARAAGELRTADCGLRMGDWGLAGVVESSAGT